MTPGLRVDVLTIFPGYFESPLRESLLGRALAAGVLEVAVHDIREHAEGAHRVVDDEPYGGGPGMVMLPDPIVRAVEALGEPPPRVILLSPQGRLLDQALARELAGARRLALVCGRYEGVDERVIELVGAEEVSVGDYVLPGGEPAALVVLEAVARLVPGVVGNPDSIMEDSFERGVFDHPHYTRPRDYRGVEVPDVLLSGDHARIAAWRRERAVEKTKRNRPDLVPDSDPQ
ncbi:MAG: tRNA (guanosine(37)-N1)-methyltransferase TrmD [Actinobacteria bacterium]|nr:tRNA (guanosine(37)-N1)-methyltransferase TrmD [Actinomycetota bacterium]